MAMGTVPKQQAQEHVLDFWKQHEKTLPLLAEAARRYLAIPALSATSELSFLMVGILSHIKEQNCSLKMLKSCSIFNKTTIVARFHHDNLLRKMRI